MKALLCALALVGAAPAAAEPAARWEGHIAEAAQRFALPEAWIRRVIAIESGGRTHRAGLPIRSPKGAMGLMQLMPATWAALRAQLGLGSDPDDPRDNILAGAASLRAMYDRFGHPGLFAAYNAGPARYAAVLAGRARLPAETAGYLSRATAATKTSGQNIRVALAWPAERLFFDVSASPPPAPPRLFAVPASSP